MLKMLNFPICLQRGHVPAKPAFELPEDEPGNAEINAQLIIYECARCGCHYERQLPQAGRE